MYSWENEQKLTKLRVTNIPIQRVSKQACVLSQNFTDKSCLVCVKSEKYAFLVSLKPGPKQLYAPAQLPYPRQYSATLD